MELLAQDEENQEIYERLIQVYAALENYQAIEELGRNITDVEILELFEGYLAKPPVFQPEGGTYQEEIEVELTGDSDCRIYYTLDGSDPKEGTEYTGPILLESGKNLWIRAISCNKFGVYGEEEQERFTIRYASCDAFRRKFLCTSDHCRNGPGGVQDLLYLGWNSADAGIRTVYGAHWHAGGK